MMMDEIKKLRRYLKKLEQEKESIFIDIQILKRNLKENNAEIKKIKKALKELEGNDDIFLYEKKYLERKQKSKQILMRIENGE